MITKMAKKLMTRHIRYRLLFMFILVAWMVSSSLAATDTAELTVAVVDTIQPTLISVEASSGTEVEVLFSEPVEEISAETITNYAIDQGINISAATLDTDLKTVHLTVSTLSEAITYTLTVNNIKDRATPPNTIAPDTTETFIYSISLMGDWKFDEGSGTTAYDTSGNSNEGTIYGASWTEGKFGTALQFDGTNDYVSVPSSSALDSIANSLSLETWLKVDEYYSYGCHLSGPGIKWEQNSAGDFGITLRSGAAEIGETWITGDPVSVWQHLAVTGDGSLIRFYKNGVELNNVTTSGDTISTGDIFIGRRADGRKHFNGVIDEVRIYNRALSAEEILADYEAGASNHPPISGPKELYP